MAIDKPASLPMHTTAKFSKNTLVAILRERYPEEGFQICHRIDRETSGVLLIARTREAASFLKRAFASRAVKKTYLALVHGIPTPSSGVIDAPMRLVESRSHLMMGVEDDGLPAVTRYRVHTAFASTPRSRRRQKRGGSIRSACTWRTSDIPSWATNFTGPASRPSWTTAIRG